MTIKKIFFDTETSGLDCRRCQIIELAMITVIDGEIVDEYDEFVKIGGFLPQKITEITGITDQMLKTEGLDESRIASDLKERLTEGTLMVAHNAQFDLSFIYYLLKRHYPNEADALVENVCWLDTLTVLKDRKNYPHKLIDAVKYYGVEKVNFHRAIDDTKALTMVYRELKKERDDLEEYENIFGYNPKYPIRDSRFDKFINYKPQPYHNRGCLPESEILPRKITRSHY